MRASFDRTSVVTLSVTRRTAIYPRELARRIESSAYTARSHRVRRGVAFREERSGRAAAASCRRLRGSSRASHRQRRSRRPSASSQPVVPAGRRLRRRFRPSWRARCRFRPSWRARCRSRPSRPDSRSRPRHTRCRNTRHRCSDRSRSRRSRRVTVTGAGQLISCGASVNAALVGMAHSSRPCARSVAVKRPGARRE